MVAELRRALRGLVLGAALLGACARAQDVSAAPRPASLETLDPEVAAAIQGALAALERAPERPEAWAELGMVYHANQLARLALPCYDRALALAPDDGKQLYRRALAELELGLEPAALDDLERACELLPSAAVPPWRLGSVRLERGELELARAAFERSIEENPSFVPARIGLARVRLLEGDARAAIVELEGVLAEMPRNRHANDLLRSARLQAGLADDGGSQPGSSSFESQSFDPWEEEVLALRAETRLARAIRLLARDKADRALPLLLAERDAGRSDIAVLGNLAEAYGSLGRREEARAALEQALLLAPENVRFHADLAEHLEADGRAAEALLVVERALAFAPERSELHRQAGALLFGLGRASEGLRELREAVRLDGRDARLWTRLGQAELALGDAAAARAAFAQALELEPPSAEALLGLAAAELAAGELERAVETLARAADHPRTDPARVTELEERLERARSSPPAPGER